MIFKMGKKHIKVLIIGMIVILFIQCYYRTHSQVRFSKGCDIEIPNNVYVIRDDYHNMWQDYAIYYDIRLTKESQNKLTESIRKSKFYNPNIFVNEYVTDDMFLDVDSFRAVWAQTKNGYKFQNDIRNRTYYSVIVDTVSQIAKFQEMSD